jgi:TRAP-type uncharacterized transport system substrate-binding protein
MRRLVSKCTIPVFVFFLALVLVGTTAGVGEASTQFISIGTGGTGGVYYPYGGGLPRSGPRM